MKRIVLATAAASALVIGGAGPAAADHDHQINNPSGCHTIPVAQQDHSGEQGRKFHGAAHKGAATEQNEDGEFVLGRGNSVVHVAGGACAE